MITNESRSDFLLLLQGLFQNGVLAVVGAAPDGPEFQDCVPLMDATKYSFALLHQGHDMMVFQDVSRICSKTASA